MKSTLYSSYMNSLQILIPLRLHLKNTTRVPLISCGRYCVLHINKIFSVDLLQFSVVALVEALSTGAARQIHRGCHQ